MDSMWLSGFTQTRLVYNIKIVSFKRSDQKLFFGEKSGLFYDSNAALLTGIIRYDIDVASRSSKASYLRTIVGRKNLFFMDRPWGRMPN